MKLKMKSCFTVSIALLFLFALTTVNSFASSDYERLEEVWGTDVFDSERWSPQSLHELFEDAGFHITQDEAAHIIELESADDIDGSHDYTMKILGISVLSGVIGGTGGGDEAAAYTSPAGVTSRLVMRNLVIPAAKTRVEQKKDDARKALNMPRTFGASLSWENVDFDNSGENGDLYGATIGMAWDNDNISYGFMLPYDYLDFDSFDANRIGLLGFGQYHMELSEELSASFTGHFNYTYTDLDIDSAGSKDLHMYGGGLSAALLYDNDLFAVSAGATYLYNKTDTHDTDMDDDEQHLLKFGVNAGVRNGDNGVFNVFAVWNSDVTDYDNDPDVDEDYFEVGMEGSFTLSDTFDLTVGYKKVLELEDFDSDQIYLGSTWKF